MKIQVLKKASGKSRSIRSVPVSRRDATRGGEEVAATTLHWRPGRASATGAAGNRYDLLSASERSPAFVAAMAAVSPPPAAVTLGAEGPPSR